MNQENNQCCPKFDPKPWDGKIMEWKNKKFVKDKVQRSPDPKDLTRNEK